MDKNKRTPLSEKQLELLSEGSKHENLNYYLSLLKEDSHNSLSFEEKLWVYKSIMNNCLYFQLFRNFFNNQWDEYLHYLENKYLEDAKFYFLFFDCDYCNDLETGKKHEYLFMLPFSQKVVKLVPLIFPDLSNQMNVKFLNSTYIQWNQELNCDKSTGFLKEIVWECKKMRREEKKKIRKQGFEKDTWVMKEKQLILFGII